MSSLRFWLLWGIIGCHFAVSVKAQEAWPPEWLRGAWQNTDTKVTLDGKPTEKSFSVASHYVFLSGHRFSVFKNSYVSATPMLGSTSKDNVVHCLFKMTRNRPAMRAEFAKTDVGVTYTSYLVASDGNRYKFVRTLLPVARDSEPFATVFQKTIETNFRVLHGGNPRPILDQWANNQKSR